MTTVLTSRVKLQQRKGDSAPVPLAWLGFVYPKGFTLWSSVEMNKFHFMTGLLCLLNATYSSTMCSSLENQKAPKFLKRRYVQKGYHLLLGMVFLVKEITNLISNFT
jgi:hypothetical protein